MLIEVNQKSTEFKALGNNVIVKLPNLEAKEDTVTNSGIIVETAQTKSQVTNRNTAGFVTCVGSGVKDIKVGDFVFWHITSGAEVKLIDGYFMIIDADRILACSI